MLCVGGDQMRRIRYVSFIVLMLLLLSACSTVDSDTKKELSNVIGNSNTESKPQSEEMIVAVDESEQESEGNLTDSGTQKILIAYFSWAENAVQDDIDAMISASVRVPGNVAQLAAWVAEETGGYFGCGAFGGCISC